MTKKYANDFADGCEELPTQARTMNRYKSIYLGASTVSSAAVVEKNNIELRSESMCEGETSRSEWSTENR